LGLPLRPCLECRAPKHSLPLTFLRLNCSLFRRLCHLKVSLVDSLDFTQSTLLISNISDSTLRLSSLLPGNIIVLGCNFDCRQALAKGPITLAPGKTFTTKVSSSPLSENSDGIVEYLDANESLSHLALGSRVVSLGGFMVGDAAVLYNDKVPESGELQLA